MLAQAAMGMVLAANLNIVTTEPTLAEPRADVPVVVEAPYWVWGMRNVIKDVDAQVDLDIVYHRGATCEDYPDRRCLKVSFEYLPDATYFGQYRYNDAEGTYSIALNKGKMPWAKLMKRQIAAHEFGHFLGFSHHDDEGVMGQTTWHKYYLPSEGEYEVLTDYYVESTE